MHVTNRQQRTDIGRSSVVAAAIVIAVLALQACSGAIDAPAGIKGSGREGKAGSVVLFPLLQAGVGGWCLVAIDKEVGRECPTVALPKRAGPFVGPVVVESWSGRSASSTSSTPVREGLVLTTSSVAALSYDGHRVQTRHPFGAPVGMRVAAIVLKGGSRRRLLGIEAPPLLPVRPVTALDASGRELAENRAIAAPLVFQWPVQSLTAGASHGGVCSLRVAGLSHVVMTGGSVIQRIEPHTDVRGRELVSCIDVNYLVKEVPLHVDVLLDAASPGSRPAALPGMRSLRRANIFGGPGTADTIVATRRGATWLVVTGGYRQAERLVLLEHLELERTLPAGKSVVVKKGRPDRVLGLPYISTKRLSFRSRAVAEVVACLHKAGVEVPPSDPALLSSTSGIKTRSPWVKAAIGKCRSGSLASASR